MKKYIFISVILLAGCTPMLQSVRDPNSGFNRTGDAVSQAAEGVGAIGGAIGGPIGSITLLGTTIFTSVWGAWQRKRKLFAQDEIYDNKTKYDHLKDVAATIVNVIDEVSDVKIMKGTVETTLGDEVKSKVKEKLAASKSYESSKKIITALKEGVADG